MRLRLRDLPPVVLAALLLGLAVRAAWVASRTETGWDVLRMQWYNATLGWLLGDYEPIGQREPTDQADYWLAETDRILAAHPDDAELAMGAAWVLDAPGHEFLARYVKFEDWSGTVFPKLDDDKVGLAVDAFEEKTAARCCELAARATELEPENVAWWRQRALLLFRKAVFVERKGPRDPQWLDVLAECARHDPDNALYDYLAAAHFWDTGADVDFAAHKEILHVKDAAVFSRGNACFQRGLAKRQLATGQEGFLATLALLRHSRAPRNEYPKIAGGRYVLIRTGPLAKELVQWPKWQANTRLQQGDPAGAPTLLRQPLRVLDQIAAAGDAWPLDTVTAYIPQWAVGELRRAAEKHPELVSAEELAAIRSREEAATVDWKVREAAAPKFNRQHPAPEAPPLIVSAAWAFALLAAWLLCAAGLVAWGLAAWLMGSRLGWRPRLGPVRHAICWVVAFALTFTVLGIAPAGLIAPVAQKWTVAGVASVVFIWLLAWGIHVWYTRRRLQYSLRGLLLLMLGVSALSAIVVSLGFDDPVWLAQLPSHVQVPAQGWAGTDAAVMGKILDADKKPWNWVLWQWAAYGGAYVSLAVCLLLVVAWYALMRRRGSAEEVQHYREAPRRARFGAMLDCAARSALALAACLLALHLALSPPIIAWSESEYAYRIAYQRDPGLYQRQTGAAIAEIKADTQWMEDTRQDARVKIIAERVAEQP